MRFWLRAVIALAIAAAVGAGAWLFWSQERLARQWAARRVASAGSFDEARQAIAVMEKAPDRDAQIRELTSKWGTGNQQFDLYLAWYVGTPKSSEFLRETFSLEFGWREELLPRWAEYWTWRRSEEPDREIASIVAHLDLLAGQEPPARIAWREVLDLQAIFALVDQARLARRLSPENWRDRYRSWQKVRPKPLPHVDHREAPFSDWRGPAPDRKRLASQ